MKTTNNFEQKGAINDDNINSPMSGNFNKYVFFEREKERRKIERV